MTELPPDWIQPDWPVSDRVGAFITTRTGGCSRAPYDSMNLGLRVNDDPAAVQANRALVRRFLPSEPEWLRQIHGTRVVAVDQMSSEQEADAAVSRTPGVPCVVMIADCLPVLLAGQSDSVVAVAHAGWRGLAAGVIENTLEAMAIPPASIAAYLGPAIGPSRFEVGAEVRNAFLEQDASADAAFTPTVTGKWLADLFLLARQRLNRAGVTAIFGGGECTASNPKRFFSHRRDGVSGRMAAFVWLKE
ncbi:MAG: peptidoglycan editing factor PgeF [Burkholderiales bacterium]